MSEANARWLAATLNNAVAFRAAPPAIHLRVVVNGQPVDVESGSVRNVIKQAIEKAGQIGAPIEQWELRTPEGDVIPHSLDDGWELTGGKLLFLNLGVPPAIPEAGGETDYARFRKEHPEMLQMAEDHLAETEKLSIELDRLRAEIAREKEVTAIYARALGEDSELLRQEVTRRREAFRNVLLKAQAAESRAETLQRELTAEHELRLELDARLQTALTQLDAATVKLEVLQHRIWPRETPPGKDEGQ